jgi:alpha-L-arabinofuranosidase
MAQLVNAIAPIMTEPGGDAWRQTTFFPLAVTSRLAVRSSLLVKLESDTYQTDLHGELPTVDAVATHDPGDGSVRDLRSRLAAAAFTLDAGRLGERRVPSQVEAGWPVLSGTDRVLSAEAGDEVAA